MARLAEWQGNLLRRTIADAGDSTDPDAVVRAVEQLVPVFEQLQSYAWRRHLAVTAGRILSGMARPVGGEGDEESVLVVGFADIASASRRCRGGSRTPSCGRCSSASRRCAPTWWPGGAAAS